MNDQGGNKNEDWERRFLGGFCSSWSQRIVFCCEVSMAKWIGRRLFSVLNAECWNLPQSAAEDMNSLEAVEVWKLDMLG